MVGRERKNNVKKGKIESIACGREKTHENEEIVTLKKESDKIKCKDKKRNI